MDEETRQKHLKNRQEFLKSLKDKDIVHPPLLLDLLLSDPNPDPCFLKEYSDFFDRATKDGTRINWLEPDKDVQTENA